MRVHLGISSPKSHPLSYCSETPQAARPQTFYSGRFDYTANDSWRQLKLTQTNCLFSCRGAADFGDKEFTNVSASGRVEPCRRDRCSKLPQAIPPTYDLTRGAARNYCNALSRNSDTGDPVRA